MFNFSLWISCTSIIIDKISGLHLCSWSGILWKFVGDMVKWLGLTCVPCEIYNNPQYIEEMVKRTGNSHKNIYWLGCYVAVWCIIILFRKIHFFSSKFQIKCVCVFAWLSYRDLQVPFSTSREAEIAFGTLTVDAEPKRGGAKKTIRVEDKILHV